MVAQYMLHLKQVLMHWVGLQRRDAIAKLSSELEGARERKERMTAELSTSGTHIEQLSEQWYEDNVL